MQSMLRSSFRAAATPRLAAASTASPMAFARFGNPAAFRLLSSDVKAKIDGAVNANPLVLFMKGTPDMPQCGFSRAVCQILEVQGVEQSKIKSYNILEDAELRESIKEYSSWPTIPQLYVKGEFVGGCDIVLSMHQSGELETLLAEAGVVPPAEATQA